MVTSCGQYTNIDFSKIPYPAKLTTWPDWEIAIKVIVCVTVQLMTFVGNLLVIAIVAHNRKMRSTTNLYIVNLAASDLLVSLFPVWILLVDSISNGWTLGAFLCKFSPFVQIAAMCSSVFTMMAIAGDRFFAVIFPLKSRVTQRRVSVVIGVVWLAAIAIGVPPLFYYEYNERQWKDHFEQFCTDVWPFHLLPDNTCDWGLTSKRAFWTLVVVVLNWIPMLVMTAAYTIIIIKLRFHRIVPSSGVLSLTAIQQKSQRKVIQMLFFVLICFMLCTIPFQVSKLYEMYRVDYLKRLPEWYNPVYFGAVILMYANSAVNPIIYGGFNENFRRGFRELINCVLWRKLTLSRGRSVAHDSSVHAPPAAAANKNPVTKFPDAIPTVPSIIDTQPVTSLYNDVSIVDLGHTNPALTIDEMDDQTRASYITSYAEISTSHLNTEHSA